MTDASDDDGWTHKVGGRLVHADASGVTHIRGVRRETRIDLQQALTEFLGKPLSLNAPDSGSRADFLAQLPELLHEIATIASSFNNDEKTAVVTAELRHAAQEAQALQSAMTAIAEEQDIPGARETFRGANGALNTAWNALMHLPYIVPPEASMGPLALPYNQAVNGIQRLAKDLAEEIDPHLWQRAQSWQEAMQENTGNVPARELLKYALQQFENTVIVHLGKPIHQWDGMPPASFTEQLRCERTGEEQPLPEESIGVVRLRPKAVSPAQPLDDHGVTPPEGAPPITMAQLTPSRFLWGVQQDLEAMKERRGEIATNFPDSEKLPQAEEFDTASRKVGQLAESFVRLTDYATSPDAPLRREDVVAMISWREPLQEYLGLVERFMSVNNEVYIGNPLKEDLGKLDRCKNGVTCFEAKASAMLNPIIPALAAESMELSPSPALTPPNDTVATPIR